MTKIRKLFVVAVCGLALSIFSTGAKAQSVAVYVSGGPNIYEVSGGTVTTVLTLSGANFESLAVGPDNVDTDGSGNAAPPFLLYACDTASNRILRFDPASPATTQQVYSGGSVVPVCGRSSSTGDFYITNKSGAGVFKLITSGSVPLANVPFLGPAIITTTAMPIGATFPSTMTGRGITQKNTGDLLAVDNVNNQVRRSPFSTIPPFATQSAFITSNLSGPVGIARFSTGEVFVANSILGKGNNAASPVAHFDRTGTAASTCPGLTFKSSQTPGFLASAETDTLFLVTASPSKGTLWSWSPSQGNCSLVAVATTPTPVTGVAVTPVPATAITRAVTSTTTNPTPTTFHFNSNAFQIIANGCTATVTAFPISQATVSSIIGLASSSLPNGADPAANLGEGGFQIAYVADWNGCQPVFSDDAFVTSIFGLFDALAVNNPRVIRCDGFQNEPLIGGSPSCQAQSTIGVYPLGGIIPADLGTTTKGTSNSTFVLVNARLTGTSTEAGQFCGFQSPLINTTNPNQAATFSPTTTNTVPVKFKLALASPSGSCQNGPYITNALALLSVAQIADGSGAPVFNPIAILSTSTGLADAQPRFTSGNQQYQFTLNIGSYAPGTYSLTVVFLSDNATLQTIVFKIL